MSENISSSSMLLLGVGKTLMELVIDGSSTINVVAESAIKRCHLKVGHHLHPFKVAWVSKTNLTITHRCKVPIQIGGYKDEILCDALSMDVAYILLGHPWLYNFNVLHY